MDCTGNIVFDHNSIYNNKLKSSSGYKDRNYISGNSNLTFTNNNLYSTFWTLSGNKVVSANISNGITQPTELSGTWQNIYTTGNYVETGITMEGITNFTIISRAKMDDNTTNAIQNIVSSPVTKLSLGFNPSGTSPYFKPTIRNVSGSYVSPTLSKFYMDKQWHTYVFIMHSGVLKGYMDGIAMLSYDASSVYSKMYATGTLKIGGQVRRKNGGEKFNHLQFLTEPLV